MTLEESGVTVQVIAPAASGGGWGGEGGGGEDQGHAQLIANSSPTCSSPQH